MKNDTNKYCLIGSSTEKIKITYMFIQYCVLIYMRIALFKIRLLRKSVSNILIAVTSPSSYAPDTMTKFPHKRDDFTSINTDKLRKYSKLIFKS